MQQECSIQYLTRLIIPDSGLLEQIELTQRLADGKGFLFLTIVLY